MRIEQLSAFVEIASSNSISIAAENLFITQPSLSRSMKLLEEELNLTLFIRSFDGVRLTEEGKALLPTIQNILYQLDSLKQQVHTLNNTSLPAAQEEFKICAMQSVIDSILVFALEEMQRVFPATKFIITVPEHLDPYTLPDLSDTDLFIGLNIGNTFDYAIQTSDLDIETIFYDSFSAVMNKSHPLATRKVVTIEDMAEYDLILHNYDFSIENFYKKIIDAPLNIILQSNNARIINKMLLSSNAILSTNNIFAANDYAANKHLVVIPEKNYHYHCFCVFKPNTSQQPFIHQLINILQNTRQQLLLNASI